ncbi:MAG: hypothetical protein DMG67_06595 [Acidobacteria bacterium]|nr:MAG: hypothetical protein DMG67_06595 [Acidobacteriota bacterium]
MSQPFTCPHCGSHDYSIVLTGCDVAGATLQEDFAWDPERGEYSSGGTAILSSESVENEAGRAVCQECEKDVSEAVAAYEEQQGSGCA